MRGAVSVALVYHFFDFTDQSEHVASIIGMTIIVVVFSTMVFGAATKPLLDLMLGKQGEGYAHVVTAVSCSAWLCLSVASHSQHRECPDCCRRIGSSEVCYWGETCLAAAYHQ